MARRRNPLTDSEIYEAWLAYVLDEDQTMDALCPRFDVAHPSTFTRAFKRMGLPTDIRFAPQPI